MTDVVLRFEAVDAAPDLNGLSLEIPASACTVLLGGGATTALRLAGGRARPLGGRIKLGGRLLDTVPIAQRGITWVTPADGPETLTHLLMAAARPLRLLPSQAAARIARSLARVGLDGFEGERAARLSPVRQRLTGLSVALVAAPRLLLLENPLGGLAPGERRTLAHALRPVLQETTALLATNEPEDALLLADRVVALTEGAVLQAGTPRALYESPGTALVAGLFGECNQLPGTIEALFAGECQVRLDCGPLVEARLGDAGGPGSRCLLAIRPEQVAVVPIAPAELGEGALPARLRDVLFLGDRVRLTLEIGDSGLLIATRPPGARLPRPGAAASVAWDSMAATAFRPIR
jgi:ABC-type Fe3+/spermidine/putrescine transport system ATPase subunit